MTERRRDRRTSRAAFFLTATLGVAATGSASASPPIRLIDLAPEDHRRVVVDREAGQYLGHPTTALLEDGRAWTPLEPAGAWGGIVVMGSLFDLKTGGGHYAAVFHDDGRYFAAEERQQDPTVFTLYKTVSSDGGLTWSFPESLLARSDVHLCEPGVIRSPDGRQLAMLLRENARRKNSHIMFSDDEGKTWSEPREMPDALNGDRHTGRYGPDGRLFVSFRSRSPKGKTAPFEGDWVGWVGTYADLVAGREGQYHVRLMDNHVNADCAYPGVEVLPDGTFVTTTYGHWTPGEAPYIVSARFTLAELDVWD